MNTEELKQEIYSRTRRFVDKDVLKAILELILEEREACAVTAWNAGMDLHMKIFESREIVSKCAQAIRQRGKA